MKMHCIEGKQFRAPDSSSDVSDQQSVGSSPGHKLGSSDESFVSGPTLKLHPKEVVEIEHNWNRIR